MPLSHSQKPQGVQSTTINKGGQGVSEGEKERERGKKQEEERGGGGRKNARCDRASACVYLH